MEQRLFRQFYDLPVRKTAQPDFQSEFVKSRSEGKDL